MNLLPLSLYIHIPWCVRKCPYCDFNSHEAGNAIPEAAYVEALLTDLQQDLPYVEGRTIETIFFGGGTPSLFSAAAIAEILQGVSKLIPIKAEAEITLEVNPGTVEQHKFKGFHEAGVNRLSIGIQSFSEQKLKSLGRIHNAQEALTAVATVINAGFDNFNLDLMHGLPDQSIAEALRDLQQAINFKPAHISWYQLTVEPNTVFYKYPPVLPESEILWEIQQQGQQLLNENGYHQYEVSAYCQPHRQAQHNLNYWQFGDYLGIGAGAHSKLTNPQTGVVTRMSKQRLPRDYLSRKFIAKKQNVEIKELPFEFMMNALRLIEGVPASLFTERTGLPILVIDQQLRIAREKELLIDNDEVIKTTELGQRFLNDCLQIFM